MATNAGRTTAAGEWSAVLAMSLCVAMLIAAEFMPVSLADADRARAR